MLDEVEQRRREKVREANRRRALPDAERIARRKEASRHAQLVARYGITAEEYDRLLARQGGVCAICHQVCSTGKRLAVDHDHETGHIRGLLCRKCNRGIGHFNDSAKLLARALEYLHAREGDELL